MDNELLEYLKGLKPESHPNGMELVKKGIEIGSGFDAGRSRLIWGSTGKYSCYLASQ